MNTQLYTLRLNHTVENSGQGNIELSFTKDGQILQKAVTPFSFALSAQDQEDVRWYLEDYLQYPIDPAPRIASRIAARMAEIGKELFRSTFHQNDDARTLWAATFPHLNDTRVEIVSEAANSASIPWELIRDPKADVLVALRVPAFVRTSGQVAQVPGPRTGVGPIRVLLVICRPKGRSDVPFRSVAKRLLKGLSEGSQEIIHLEVLRPPTFGQLARELRAAKSRGEPYHIVHFDGHGSYGASKEGDSQNRGYLMFENPALKDNLEPVGGFKLGELLAETEVPTLILNACRSAHAVPPTQPVTVAGNKTDNEARIFGSLAQEVVQAGAGATGVVAMRYNIFVDTAAQFTADLYASLVHGSTLGEAVTLGRKQLKAQPLRGIAFDPVPLEDWSVPVAFERAPISLFPKQSGPPKLKIMLDHSKDQPAPGRRTLDPKLPPRPDAGFFGRDETLLALDRAFDRESVVLLHAYAGSGKTTAAAEFARWYSDTGGIEGPVLYTSFERFKPLARVLDDFGNVFQRALEESGVQWGALDDANRRKVALQVLEQAPVLWIWDNVEPVAGFPSGTQSEWSAEEQRELTDFLRTARDNSKANVRPKFLLTSRRDEQGWLGNLPTRISVPPMPFLGRLELARAFAEKHGRRLIDVQDWRPLLEFSQGNPMTLTVLIGQAMKDGLRTQEQIEAFVAKLRAGEAVFKDEKSEGRSRSLGAALSYGFENAFTDPERRQLALLHLYQGFVDIDTLRIMGNSKEDYHLPELKGMDRETGMALLDRATEIGLLTALGGGYYSIHPALPWFFKKMFDEYYGKSPEQATRAFAEAMAELAVYYANSYRSGARNVVGWLAAEEANLLHARQLARINRWWDALMGTMYGLDELYEHTGYTPKWAHLVEELVPDFFDSGHGDPLPGREKHWSLLVQYRVGLAKQARQWAEAERLQTVRVTVNRRKASEALLLPPEQLDDARRDDIQALAVSLGELGQIQAAMGKPECLDTYNQVYDLAIRVQDQQLAAITSFNLASCYKDPLGFRDLDKSDYWYQKSLELRPRGDAMGRAKSLGQLGAVELERFLDGKQATKPSVELTSHLRNALKFYFEALELLPSSAINEHATTHHQIGLIFSEAGELENALEYYRKAINYKDSTGDVYSAAETRFNVALTLAKKGSFPDAREYALAALRGYQTYGAGAAKNVEQTLKLIAIIDKDMRR